jgi:hypothetical protein
MRASNFYSAEVVEPSARFGRRIRVKNRGTGDVHYYDYGNNPNRARVINHMEGRVLEVYRSIPYLSPRILWYDPELNTLFFELIPRDQYGRYETETCASL